MTKVAIAVEGWNAEAALGFARAAARFRSTVTLSLGRETVNGKDDLEVMTLGPEPGDEVVMAVEGKDEKEAFATLLARLLSVVERPEDRLAAVLGPAATGRQAALRPPNRRLADVTTLGVEEVAPARPRRKRRAGPSAGPKRAAGQRRPRKRKK